MSCKSSIIILLICCTLALALPFASPAQAESVEEHWDKLHDKLGDTLEMLDTQRKLPDSSWNPLKKDKSDLEDDIEDLLDEAIEILNISDMAQIKEQVNESMDNIRRFEERIGELNTKKMMAPKEEAGWKIWKKDVQDYEEEIEEIREAIAENKRNIEQLKAALLKKINAIGIDLDAEQMDTLIFSVTGDDDIEIISVFNNIKIITQKLKDLSVSSGEQIETARRYYGMHTVLLKILLYLQGRYVEKVDREYVPMLAGIEEENRQLMQQTQSLLQGSQSAHRNLYQANLDAQRLTDRTVTLYRRYLENNKRRMTRSKDQIVQEYRIAENTYQTVSTAHNLIALMRDADTLFNSLNELQIPDLIRFDNSEMKEEFKKLSSKMATE